MIKPKETTRETVSLGLLEDGPSKSTSPPPSQDVDNIIDLSPVLRPPLAAAMLEMSAIENIYIYIFFFEIVFQM